MNYPETVEGFMHAKSEFYIAMLQDFFDPYAESNREDFRRTVKRRVAQSLQDLHAVTYKTSCFTATDLKTVTS